MRRRPFRRCPTSARRRRSSGAPSGDRQSEFEVLGSKQPFSELPHVGSPATLIRRAIRFTEDFTDDSCRQAKCRVFFSGQTKHVPNDMCV
jgi:hypothetical protein